MSVSSALCSLFLYVPPIIFTMFLVAATIPSLLNEPYPIVVVGSTLDTGSNVITLLAPTAAWFALLFGGIAALVFGVYVALDRSGFLSSYCSRLWLPEEAAKSSGHAVDAY